MPEKVRSSRDSAAAARMRERRAGGRQTEAMMAALLLVNAEFNADDYQPLADALEGSRFSVNDLHELATILMAFTSKHEASDGKFIGLGRFAREAFESRSTE